ncbi:DUF1211 domain-containing protein [Actinoplanes bogorensis]|uniref:DUF1211 domain-containing protein n=1 Tax=Paractinoplanes bogorensis TaxID=1610840 RepID=A0ABS5YUY3_9ACTN|nr:TMEM175 family protein [Actinoplanes bogorensis]MBU2667257.1 DUF1211 domain-containing protein [Actinoplanes bogorensis]
MTESNPRLGAERMTFFSDAAAAIALTLLILPLVELVPEAVARDERPAEVITGNSVPIGSFLLSFFVIWRIWSVHHRMFNGIETIDNRVVRLNSLWLLCVVALPFAAEMVGAYGAERVVIALYIGVLLASSITLTLLALALRRTDPAATTDRGGFEQLIGNAVCLTLAFVIALAVPGAGYWPLALLLVDGPILAVLRRRQSKFSSPVRVRLSSKKSG